jgi:hypothetical protein
MSACGVVLLVMGVAVLLPEVGSADVLVTVALTV